jgi:hypothetical protein
MTMQSVNSSKVGTFDLTSANSPFVISPEDGVRVIAMKLLSGAASYTGTMVVNGLNSGPIALVINDPVTIGGDQPIDTLEIDISSGILTVITRS